MLEQAIKDEMRIYVIEYFVSNLFAVACLQTPAPLEFWEKGRDQMIAGAQKKTFPMVDAAMSDLYSAELESALVHLASMVSEQINVVLKSRKSS